MRLSITNCISVKDRMKSNKQTNITRVVETLNSMFTIKSTNPTPLANSVENEFYRSAWAYVDTLDAFAKRIVWLKYTYEFKVQNSNKQIAELMCCSEETVRKSLIKFSDGMRQEVLCSYMSV
jgi:hypothetical protein